jgi:hypothetical protein
VAYALQVEQIEREAYALMSIAPHTEEPVPTLPELLEAFEVELVAEPTQAAPGSLDELHALLTMGGR